MLASISTYRCIQTSLEIHFECFDLNQCGWALQQEPKSSEQLFVLRNLYDWFRIGRRISLAQ